MTRVPPLSSSLLGRGSVRLRALAVAAASVAVLATATEARAAGRIYLADTSSKIAYAGLDNSGGGDLVTTGASVSQPWGVAIDSATNRIYWANSADNKISYASLDGGGGDLSTTGASVSTPQGVAIDPVSRTIYWANGGDNRISYASLDGGGGADLVTTGATVDLPWGIAVDPAAGRVYWANWHANKISYADINGSAAGDLVTTGATVSGPIGVAVDPEAGRVYWANNSAGKISWTSINGGGGGDINTTGATTGSVQGVAVDPATGRVYWANNGVPRVSWASVGGAGGGDVTTAGSTATSPDSVVLLEPPLGAEAPVISGSTSPGSVLSCSQGSWAPDMPSGFLYRTAQQFSYQWTLNGNDIAGATDASYEASAAGQYRCVVTASNAGGRASQTSSPVTITPPPTCSGLTASTAAGRPVVLQLDCSDASGDAVSYSLDSFPAHGSLTSFDPALGQVRYVPAAGYSGTDSFTYHATSAHGSSTTQSVSITVTPQPVTSPPAGSPPAGSPPVTSPPSVPPTITGARLTHKRFRIATRAMTVSARRAPIGSTFRFTLSQPAQLRITIIRALPGRRHAGKCVAPARGRSQRRARRCRRLVTAETLVRTHQQAGAGTVPFNGRLGRMTLHVGSYRAVLSASDSNGTSSPVTLGFTIVR